MRRLFLILSFTILCSVGAAQQKYHDAAIFNAPNGNVKYIEYEGGRVSFAEDGRLIKKESSYLELFSKYEIKRNAEGYPISVTTDYDKTTYEYDEKHRISKRTITGPTKMIISYDYSSYPSVKISLLEQKAGQPQKTDEFFNMNGFDFRGNWIQKGKQGETVSQQHLKTENLGSVGSVATMTTWDTTYKHIGREKENRKIVYWKDQNYTFKRSDSPKEINLYYAVREPFFFGVGYENRDIEKYIKKNKIEHSRVIYGPFDSYAEITIPSSDKVFFGFPIVNMRYQHYTKIKIEEGTHYRFTIQIKSKAEREAFIDFLIAEGEKSDTLKESGNDGLLFQDGPFKFYLLMTTDGIDICRTADWDHWENWAK